jgi:hypothetical protein
MLSMAFLMLSTTPPSLCSSSAAPASGEPEAPASTDPAVLCPPATSADGPLADEVAGAVGWRVAFRLAPATGVLLHRRGVAARRRLRAQVVDLDVGTRTFHRLLQRAARSVDLIEQREGLGGAPLRRPVQAVHQVRD